jgi:hypothetical protein
MIGRRSACLLAIAAVMALACWTDSARAQPANQREATLRLTPATRSVIDAVADSLAGAGLPSAVLYDKAAEGVLKGASEARIVVVVRALAARLRESRRLLGEGASADDLSAASSALYAGVAPALVRRAATTRSERPDAPSVSLTLTVLAALVSQHVPPEIATASLESLLRRGARELDLREFQRAVEGDIGGGSSPVDATTIRAQHALQTIDSRRTPE